MQLENYATDEPLFVKGGQSDALYLIQEGWIKLYADDENSGGTTFGPGNLLGETDFFLGRPRTATARPSGEITVWILDNNALSHLLAGQLIENPLLRDLLDDERNVIARHLSPYRYLPRETIYHSGDPPTGLFFIERGQVWLLSDADNYIELSPGQTFGERAVISNTPHSYTAQAATEVILWQLSPADFASLTDTYPSIKTNLSRNLHASLTEALAIASLILAGEIEALEVACGQKNGLVKKLHQVCHTLAWLKDSQLLL